MPSLLKNPPSQKVVKKCVCVCVCVFIFVGFGSFLMSGLDYFLMVLDVLEVIWKRLLESFWKRAGFVVAAAVDPQLAVRQHFVGPWSQVLGVSCV